MNKGDLIESMAQDANISKSQAGEALNSFMENVKVCLQQEDKVTLVGFGTFSISKRAERKGRNPQTGKEITIKAKNVVKFKPGKELATAV